MCQANKKPKKHVSCIVIALQTFCKQEYLEEYNIECNESGAAVGPLRSPQLNQNIKMGNTFVLTMQSGWFTLCMLVGGRKSLDINTTRCNE